jgi:hypothetical protein
LKCVFLREDLNLLKVKVRVKGKAVPVLLFSTEHHAIKVYVGVDV